MIHHYKLSGYNIILDISSGCIHCVDCAAYDAILMYNEKSKDEIVNHLITKYDEIPLEEALLLVAKIEELEDNGSLFSSDEFAPKIESNSASPLKALCLNVSHKCNMACTYCFTAKNFSSDAEKLMSVDVGAQAIDFLIAQSGGQKYLDVDFFGGEPLLNWEVVKDIVAYARGREQGSGKKFRFTLTTNGLDINDDVIDFTNKEMHNVVLSLDGREETHDNMRKLSNGNGSYAEVMPKIKQLVNARNAKGYYIRGTFTDENPDFTSDIFHLANLGFKELAVEPVVSKSGTPYGINYDDLPKILGQYETLAIEMLKRRSQGRGFNFYHFALDFEEGPCLHKRIAGCGVCSEYMAVTPNGDLYPCHQFVGDDKFLIGNVFDGIIKSEMQDEFASCNIYSKNECANCWARFYCSGGCAANAYYASGSIFGVNKLECELIKKRLECAIMLQVSQYV